MSMPYVVGQWVRGNRFYGRASHLHAILDSADAATWLVGGRRVGKTSLLRQLELLAGNERPGLLPLYWDLQGADTPEELRFTFDDAVLDAEERLVASGVEPETLTSLAAPEALARIAKGLAAHGRTLLLLCDEAEELGALGDDHPALVQELVTVMAGGSGVRTVLAASLRLTPLAATITQLSLGPLEPGEARSLIHQDQLAPEHRPRLPAEAVAAVRAAGGDHPYLLQLLAKRTVVLGAFEAARDAVAADQMIEHFFAVDMALLDEIDRRVLGLVARGATTCDELASALAVGCAELDDRCALLEGLGYLRREGDGSVAVHGGLLRQWVRRAVE